MSARLLIAPAAFGKTRACLDRVRSALQAAPLAEVWVVLPDRTQAVTFRRRLAEQGAHLALAWGHAVIVPAPYQPFLREAATEFGMPLRFAGGELFNGNPAIAAVINLLELTL